MAFVPSTFERKWAEVLALGPIAIADHKITVPSTAGLHTKQKVILSLAGNVGEFFIKRVLSDTQIQVGAEDKDMALFSNPTEFNGGMLTMPGDQNRNPFGSDPVLRAVYEEEPAVALRNVLVNRYGEHFGSIKDSNGVNRLAVDGQFTADVDVQVTVNIDGEYNALTNPDPDDIGLIASTRNITPGKPHQVQRLTAKPGTVNTDVVALDISLHDHLGNNYTQANPLPTNKTNQLVPENHDEIVLTRDPSSFVITQAVYKLGGSTVATVAFDRDSFLNLTRAYRV